MFGWTDGDRHMIYDDCKVHGLGRGMLCEDNTIYMYKHYFRGRAHFDKPRQTCVLRVSNQEDPFGPSEVPAVLECRLGWWSLFC